MLTFVPIIQFAGEEHRRAYMVSDKDNVEFTCSAILRPYNNPIRTENDGPAFRLNASKIVSESFEHVFQSLWLCLKSFMPQKGTKSSSGFC